MSIVTIIGIILTATGLLGVILMIARKVPLLVKLGDVTSAPSVSLGERFKNRLKGIKYSTYRPLTLDWFEKSLRKFRVLILKMDNLFINLIKKSRERSQVWKIRSGAWMEHTRLKKKEKLQVLETLDKVQISQELEKITKEVAKDEDKALKEKIEEKIETLANGNGQDVLAEPLAEISEANEKAAADNDAVAPVSEEEKKYIDMIAENPKDGQAYRGLGFIYLNQKNYSDARACFRRALKLNSQDEEVRIKLNEIKGLRSKKAVGGV